VFEKLISAFATRVIRRVDCARGLKAPPARRRPSPINIGPKPKYHSSSGPKQRHTTVDRAIRGKRRGRGFGSLPMPSF
jgi:hypothetical protein